MIGCLLSGGADPDTSDQRLRTPLHYLTEWRHEGVEAILQLCFTGADPNLQDLHGWAPLHMAASMGQPAVCRALLEMGGADPSIRDQDGLRPADLAKTPAVRNMFKVRRSRRRMMKRHEPYRHSSVDGGALCFCHPHRHRPRHGIAISSSASAAWPS